MKTATRRDRLLSILYRGATTVAALAGDLGVSERTVRRDLGALREAGYTIRAAPGPGGGVRLDPNSRPRAVHFEVAEVVGLALAVAVLEATPHVPFTASAESALDRARRALSSERRRALRALERRILVGQPCSEPVRQSLGDVDGAVLSAFEGCFTDGRAMTFDYVDAAGTTTSRHIECIALVVDPPAWYVLAWDLAKDASRLFRMDRIVTPAAAGALARQHTLDEARPAIDPARDVWSRRTLA